MEEGRGRAWKEETFLEYNFILFLLPNQKVFLL